MAIRIGRQDFLSLLARVEPGRSKRDLMEQTSCFVFSDGWLATFNDEICCRTKTPFPEDFVGAVPGDPLVKVLDSMADEEVELRPTEKELMIVGKRKRAGIRMESEILLPTESVQPPKKWVNLTDGFADAVKRVAEVAGSDEEDFLTVCVLIAPDRVEACDTISAARFDIATPVTRPVLVRAKSIKQIKPLGLIRIGQTDDWLHMRNDTIIFSVRLHLEEFFDTAPLWEFHGTQMKLPKGAAAAAKLGGVFSSEDKEDDRVTVTLTDGKMRVRGEGSHGWAEEDLETSYRGDKVAFRISPAMLEYLVAEHNEVEVGPTKLRVTGEKWSFLTTLGRPDEPKPSRGKKEPVAVEAGDADGEQD